MKILLFSYFANPSQFLIVGCFSMPLYPVKFVEWALINLICICRLDKYLGRLLGRYVLLAVGDKTKQTKSVLGGAVNYKMSLKKNNPNRIALSFPLCRKNACCVDQARINLIQHSGLGWLWKLTNKAWKWQPSHFVSSSIIWYSQIYCLCIWKFLLAFMAKWYSFIPEVVKLQAWETYCLILPELYISLSEDRHQIAAQGTWRKSQYHIHWDI